ncbi:MAG: hypothetical protein HY809_02845 [Nitrospirae bacterium]|nr:hypothetical protein [Nitrospirota bacterium]
MNTIENNSNTIVMILLSLLLVVIPCSAFSEVVERVVAIVNDDIILYSEFSSLYKKALDSGSHAGKEEILDSMINRLLVIQQAKQLRLDVFAGNAERDDDLLYNNFIERRIKAFIHIPFEDIEKYYLENPSQFNGKSFYDVQAEIEDAITAKQLNEALPAYIKQLREDAYIRIQLEGDTAD